MTAQSARLIETAIDCGITYFDTAPMYGHGDAETVLGDVLLHQRGRVILASKAGILPPSRSLPVRVLNRGAKLLRKVAPPIASWVPTPRAAQNRFHMFRLSDIRKSLETSLRKLRTDYLDIFLLHECTEADVENAELKVLLEGLQKAGKVRAFGIATGIDETIRIAQKRPYLSSVLQIPSHIWNMNIGRLPFSARGSTITHSILKKHRLDKLTDQLATDDALAKKWKSAVQIAPSDKVSLAQLLLAHALHSNPEGVVLFFSSKRENIRANARVATEIKPDRAQLIALTALMKGIEWR